jgi:hypothetical protein
MLPCRIIALSTQALFVLTQLGCGSSEGPGADAGSVRCLRSLNDYCANAIPQCVRHIDSTNPANSFCEQFAANVVVDPSSCFDAGALGLKVVVATSGAGAVRVDRRYLYDTRTGDLIAVQDYVTEENVLGFGACLGGPLTLADSICTDFLQGFTCREDAGLPDGSAE